MPQSCPPVESQDLLSLLRTETREQHRALEQHPLLRQLLSPDLSLRDYGLILQAFWCFYRTLEPGLMSVLPGLKRRAPGPYQYRSRLPLLEADFANLLLPQPTPIMASNATISHPSPGQALGVLYVLEGATQGGRVIAAKLHKSLGLSWAEGAHYFNQHQQENGWPAFCAWLCHYSWSEHSDAVVQGARQTFAGLAAQLNFWQVYSSDPLPI